MSLSQYIRDNTNDGRNIARLLIDVMEADRGRQKCTAKHECHLADPLSLRERVGVRVKSTNTCPCKRDGGQG